MIKKFICLLLMSYSSFTFAGSGSESLYQLELNLTDQDGEHIAFDVFRGQSVLISMFYARCPHVCPLIISTLQKIESEFSPQQRKQLRILLVSLDPENDTVVALNNIAKQRKIDLSRWKLARADAADVRTLAAMLGIRYRKLPDGEFNHSTLITLLDANGAPVLSSNKLAHTDPALLAAIETILIPFAKQTDASKTTE